MQFDFYLPCRIRVDRGGLKGIGRMSAAYGSTAFVVLSSAFHKKPFLNRLKRSFEAAGVACAFWCKPHGEPSPAMIADAVQCMQPLAPDLVVAIGGGSVLDVGKAISGLYPNGTEIKPYLEGVGDNRKPVRPPLPWIAVPTTAGTGAEVTKNAVVSDLSQGYKKSFRDERLYAREVLLDATLAAGLPRGVTAESGMDALTQLIESYTCSRATPMTRALTEAGLKAMRTPEGNALELLWDRPEDLDLREQMAYAAMLSGVSLSNAGLGAAHGFAAALGVLYGVPHGRACAMMLPFTLAANALSCLEDYSVVHGLLGLRGGTLREDILLLNRKFGIPSDLKHLALDEDAARALIRAASGSSMSGNPVRFTEDEWYACFLKYDLI